ncbi:thioesterase II family protein [Haloactinomyces albus]|uniref:Surfactin synthase thioesterase subunit n=1 Tax=Haloactinomyces albus TaxID=1352928 RepID=A0AAE4CP97_9ACTN|nr:thioesterase domain-containing protein [Haloactinomyces albus]MDR7304659.1 surfactin synthase thioesterase subunit [Haloactinomyces albus]
MNQTKWIERRNANPQARIRLFCYPHAGGAASAFQTWQQSMPETVEVCPVQPPGRWARYHESPFRRVEPAAASFVEAIESLSDLPFVFFGHSLGALVMFEATRLLEAGGGQRPRACVVGARGAPHVDAGRPARGIVADDECLLAWVTERYGQIPGFDDPGVRELFLPVLRADLEAFAHYAFAPAPPLATPLFAFSGDADKAVRAEDLNAWREHTTGSFEATVLPGDHFFVHDQRSGFLARLAELLEKLTIDHES